MFKLVSLSILLISPLTLLANEPLASIHKAKLNENLIHIESLRGTPELIIYRKNAQNPVFQSISYNGSQADLYKILDEIKNNNKTFFPSSKEEEAKVNEALLENYIDYVKDELSSSRGLEGAELERAIRSTKRTAARAYLEFDYSVEALKKKIFYAEHQATDDLFEQGANILIVQYHAEWCTPCKVQQEHLITYLNKPENRGYSLLLIERNY